MNAVPCRAVVLISQCCSVFCWRWFLIAVLMVMITINSSSADENDSATIATDASTGSSDPAPIQIPARLLDGLPIRTIGLYQSQLDELIPEHFKPISVERLLQGLSGSASQAGAEQASRLIGAVYWVDLRDDLLISRRSEIDLQSNAEMVIRHSLGQVNLAIDQPTVPEVGEGLGVRPHLENEANGDLVAVFDGSVNPRSKIQFKWQLRGKPAGPGYNFYLQLPRAPQTRIVLSVPRDIEIKTLDGVLRLRSGPPPDADTLGSGERKRWYELDAGGLKRVRILARPDTRKTAANPLIVRGNRIRCDVDSTELKWVCLLQIQPPDSEKLPVLRFRNTTVTSVRLNSFDVPFTATKRGSRRDIRIEAPQNLFENQGQLVPLTISGTSPVIGGNWCDLPMPIWLGNVTIASTIDQIQVAVAKELQIANWEPPSDWTTQPPQLIDDGSVMYVASGPPLWQPPRSIDQRSRSGATETWTAPRLRFARRTSVDSAEIALKLELGDGSLSARARITAKSEPDQLTPFRIRIEPQWNLDSIAFVHSGRVIEKPRVRDPARIVTLWPEPEDIVAGEIAIEIIGSRLVQRDPGRLNIPASWFAAPQRIPGKLFAAILRPTALNWTTNTLAEPEQINPAKLTESASKLFGALPPETLLFQPEFGRTPTVSLQTPVASFDATTQFYVLRDQNELAEHLEIEIESSGQRLQQITVQTGRRGDRPPLVWSLGGRNQSPLIRLPASAVTIGAAEQDGLYTINLADQGLRGQLLIGQRRYESSTNQAIQLPSLPEAASVRSHAWIGPGLKVIEKTPGVDSILFDSDQQTFSYPFAGTISRNQIHLKDCVGLRYEQTQSPKITVSKSDGQQQIAVVYGEQIRILASSRGVDQIEATYLLSPSQVPVQIQFEPSLRLVSLSRNGAEIELKSISDKQITIPPRSEPETVRLIWNRDQDENLWLRRCGVPPISVSGIVLQSGCELIPASDAFAPAALLQSLPTASQGLSPIQLRPGDTVSLVRRNLVLATGWLLAMLVFTVSWFVAKKNLLALVWACTVVVAALLLWWPWKLALIGWLIVPMVSAGMLVTALRLGAGEQAAGTTERRAKRDSENHRGAESGAFSVSTTFRLLAWLMLTATITGTTSVAQEADSSTDQTASEPAIDVLVPVTQDGQQVGDSVLERVVYIPESIHRQILRPTEASRETPVHFQSAHYRVRIDRATTDRAITDRATTDRLSTDRAPANEQVVEAEYWIRLDETQQATNRVRLPFAASLVQKIELLGSDYGRLSVNAETKDSLIATLPRGDQSHGNQIRLRVTLQPQVTEIDQWNRLELPIPKVAASLLSVESEQNIDALRIGGTTGVVVSATQPRRWVESIGPQNQLVIEYRFENQSQEKTTSILRRQYLIDAGRRSIVIDCQLEPPEGLTRGDSFQFVVRDERLPLITSPNWQLAETELLGPARRKITVDCKHDDPGPIRLNWTQTIESVFDQGSPPFQITIPEVVAMGTTETSPAWIGLQCDPMLQFAPLIGTDIEPLSVDHFKAAWTGHRVRLDRAYLGLTGVPNPTIQPKPASGSTVVQQHHLHVTADRLELRFTATIEPDNRGPDLYALRYPRQWKLLELSINETPQPIQRLRGDQYFEIPLGDQSGSEPIEIRAAAILALDDQAQFSLPRLTITGAAIQSDEYLVSRDPSIAIDAVDGAQPDSLGLPRETAVDWLRQGWSPAMYWQFLPPQQTEQAYRVEACSKDLDCQQMISIDRPDGKWMMQANIHFDSDRIPDVIDLQLPNRWCDSLEVDGALQWLLLDVGDSSPKLIRIRYDRRSVGKQSLTVRGRLRGAGNTRLSVPSIQVLGQGRRQIYLDVPSRSPEGELNQWQTNAVEPSPAPADWTAANPVKTSERTIFVVSNPAWSVELAALPEIDADPVAFAFDGQVYSQPDAALVHCRWDLFPGSLDAVDVRIPAGTTILCAWSAGRSVETNPLDHQPGKGGLEHRCFRMPLAVSRFPQAVEILLRVSSQSAQAGQYIPKLIGVPVRKSWLVHHVPKQPPGRGPSLSALLSGGSQSSSVLPLVQQRQLSLGSSIVESIETSERISGRSQQELARLLGTWLIRYRAIQNQTGMAATTELIQSQWRELDSRLAAFFQRNGIDPDSLPIIPPTDVSPLDPVAEIDFGGFDYSGFQIDQITDLSATEQSQPLQPIPLSDRGLETLIVNGLTLAAVVGVLACLIPVYRFVTPIIAHPAFWLALMGVFGFALAPVGVAAALVLLAVALPVLPTKKPVSGLRD